MPIYAYVMICLGYQHYLLKLGFILIESIIKQLQNSYYDYLLSGGLPCVHVEVIFKFILIQ